MDESAITTPILEAAANELQCLSLFEFILDPNSIDGLLLANLALDLRKVARDGLSSTAVYRLYAAQFPLLFASLKRPSAGASHCHSSIFKQQKSLAGARCRVPRRKGGKTMSKQFRGRTEDADSIFLSAEFWKPGAKIAGKVIRVFDSENGPCYVLDLVNPIPMNGDTVDRVSVGNLTGFRMALQAAGLDRLQVNDAIHLECTGLKSTTKGSPRPNFEVEITRP